MIDFFAFCVYKNVSQMILYINVNNISSHHWKTTCTFYYIQKNKIRNVYIYIQRASHFSNSKTICVTFYSPKSRHFTLRDFSWNFWNWHLYILKSMILCVTWRFIFKDPDTSKKARQFALRFFIYKKSDTLRYAIFHGMFEMGGRWGAYL